MRERVGRAGRLKREMEALGEGLSMIRGQQVESFQGVRSRGIRDVYIQLPGAWLAALSKVVLCTEL